jgi:hypothetical protein
MVRASARTWPFTNSRKDSSPDSLFQSSVGARQGEITPMLMTSLLESWPPWHSKRPRYVGCRTRSFIWVTPHRIKLAELLESPERTTGRKAIREQKPMQPGDVPLAWADISKAGRLLNYRPKAGLSDGLKGFVDCLSRQERRSALSRGTCVTYPPRFTSADSPRTEDRDSAGE